jgi:uncharacterized membrane protein
MLELLIGLVIFFGIHSISIFAMPLRDRLAAKSPLGWKAIYSLISLLGIVLAVRGYADLKQTAAMLYASPLWLRDVAAGLLLPSFVLFFAPYFPGRIKNSLRHPQLLALILWAGVHLLLNGSLADVLLFGSFLVWGIVDRISMNNRETRTVPHAPESKANDIILVVVGLGIYLAVVFWAHEAWFGIRPIS